jgi:alpha-N-acetylglucosaminidase
MDLLAWLLGVVLAAALARVFAPQIYDALIVSMTALWYRTALEAIPEGARVLDVGIGTATALARNASLVRDRKLRIVGVDYDASYVAHATRTIAASPILRSSGTVVLCKSVYDDSLLSAANAAVDASPATLFDAVYFSGSLSLMPDPAGALRAVARVLAPGGVVIITQTFQRAPSRVLAAIKPLLKYLTTVDFGRLLLEADLAGICDAGGFRITERRRIPGSVNNALQSALILICQPQ